MNINATVLIQAGNFLIVYWMLRLLLFKPIVAIIEHEKTQENALQDMIDQQKKSLVIQEKERQRYWFICQEYFTVNQPPLFHKKHSLSDEIEYDTKIVSPLSADAIADTITYVRKALEEKIKHVH